MSSLFAANALSTASLKSPFPPHAPAAAFVLGSVEAATLASFVLG